MEDDNVYQWYIMKCSPSPSESHKFIGPFENIDERDAECIRLQNEENEKTSRIPNKRMSTAAYSYWRCNVLDHAASANRRMKKVA